MEERKKNYIEDFDWFNMYFKEIEYSENDCVIGQCKRYTHLENDIKKKPKNNYIRIKGKKYIQDKEGHTFFYNHFIQSATCSGVLGGSCKKCDEYIETYEEIDYCLEKFENHLSMYLFFKFFIKKKQKQCHPPYKS
ncbi:hypothetical protein DDB_G0273283 [Dictyostelium discoideum AX4]|uniref:Uncharacterized protein n=1 Tax=Dictyostelium discoideum TaxID=44689 RepID=Q556U2_DICDI|nr:hypothetical protein DDB_G0273821 [Dictyostelium discoideum AX4]XP_644723.1 hypothetical protein DDB_G0273283 [Dictyostelium discoideum AX4]EAL70601.1 hypothetical protein DDB_G0273821 [Dictyostelium discoideum AX4]EAL70859.1 hypothetical protein DDB_G0273283 [Dictyostelium discoideum AX4]|eukprot:XP_644527.1 hypothetical protein DDB_G0273821 [Dictyostelium discoideum AX4]